MKDSKHTEIKAFFQIFICRFYQHFHWTQLPVMNPLIITAPLQTTATQYISNFKLIVLILYPGTVLFHSHHSYSLFWHNWLAKIKRFKISPATSSWHSTIRRNKWIVLCRFGDIRLWSLQLFQPRCLETTDDNLFDIYLFCCCYLSEPTHCDTARERERE